MNGKQIIFALAWVMLVLLLFLLFGCAEESKTRVYSLEEIGTHSAQSNCWVVMDGGVYDVTQLVLSDPTNPISGSCGKEINANLSQRNSPPKDTNFMTRPEYTGPMLDLNAPRDFNNQKRDFNGNHTEGTQQRNGSNMFFQYLIGKLG